MRCPGCGGSVNSHERGCQRCGQKLGETVTGLLKTSTILVSVDDGRSVYRSMRELPEPLRNKLIESTNSLLSTTILIADRRGQQEIQRVVRDPPPVSGRSSSNSTSGAEPPPARRRLSLPLAIASLSTGAVVLAVWLIRFLR